MTALSRAAFVVLLIAVTAGIIAIRCGGDDEGDEMTPTATATPSPEGASTATATTATPTPTPTATPTPTPTATPTRTAIATPSPAAPPGPAPAEVEGFPYSLSDLADALAPGGIEETELYDPASACAGAAVGGVPFVVAGDAATERFAVWVLWVYPDSEARQGDWQTGQRAEPLVEGCEPPNGFVYWNSNLLLWFIGFWGDDIPPASPPVSREEVREHPVIRAFLGLTQ